MSRIVNLNRKLQVADVIRLTNCRQNWYQIGLSENALYILTQFYIYKKFSYRRGATRRFVSLNISLISHSRSLKVIGNGTIYHSCWRSIVMLHQFIFSFSFTFLFVPCGRCGRLSWLSVSFLLRVKYTVSYRIISVENRDIFIPYLHSTPVGILS